MDRRSLALFVLVLSLGSAGAIASLPRGHRPTEVATPAPALVPLAVLHPLEPLPVRAPAVPAPAVKPPARTGLALAAGAGHGVRSAVAGLSRKARARHGGEVALLALRGPAGTVPSGERPPHGYSNWLGPAAR
jgi:hypothetical protein